MGLKSGKNAERPCQSPKMCPCPPEHTECDLDTAQLLAGWIVKASTASCLVLFIFETGFCYVALRWPQSDSGPPASGFQRLKL